MPPSTILLLRNMLIGITGQAPDLLAGTAPQAAGQKDEVMAISHGTVWGYHKELRAGLEPAAPAVMPGMLTGRPDTFHDPVKKPDVAP